MEALRASYGDSSSDTDANVSSPGRPSKSESRPELPLRLPPPPLSLLSPPRSLGGMGDSVAGQPTRVRSFPHVEGNYALHVYIPVYIPSIAKKEMAQFLMKVSSHVPDLHVVDVDVPLSTLCKDEQRLEQVALGREFHISLGRTVPVRVHQVDSIVSMFRQKLQFQKAYWIDFNRWEVFVNDDHTRSFLSVEVLSGGVAEITKQINVVNQIYKLHNLPEFYKDPRPHISLVWALGDISDLLKRVVGEAINRPGFRGSFTNRIFACKFGSIECRIGQKVYKICKALDA